MGKPAKRRDPLPGERWRHFKGGEYEIVAVAKGTWTDHPRYVVYRAADGTVWVRPLAEFMGSVRPDEPPLRFELVGLRSDG